jgi:hypothetical protein
MIVYIGYRCRQKRSAAAIYARVGLRERGREQICATWDKLSHTNTLQCIHTHICVQAILISILPVHHNASDRPTNAFHIPTKYNTVYNWCAVADSSVCRSVEAPDWAPSDFHPFSPIKEALGGRHSDRMRPCMTGWHSNLKASRGIYALVGRWRRCVGRGGGLPWRLMSLHCAYSYLCTTALSIFFLVFIWMALLKAGCLHADRHRE